MQSKSQYAPPKSRLEDPLKPIPTLFRKFILSFSVSFFLITSFSVYIDVMGWTVDTNFYALRMHANPLHAVISVLVGCSAFALFGGFCGVIIPSTKKRIYLPLGIILFIFGLEALTAFYVFFN